MPQIPHRLRITALLALLLFASACATTDDNGAAGEAVSELHTFFDDEWDRRLRENPTYASAQGDRRWNDQWPDLSDEARADRQAADQEALNRLDAIDRSALPEEEQLNYDLFRTELERRIEGHDFDHHLITLNQRGGIQSADDTAGRVPLDDVSDYEDWIARLEGFGDYMDQTIDLMYEGIETGWTLPQVIAERIPPQIESQLVEHPDESGFYEPFKDMPDRISESEQERLREAGAAAIKDVVLPAYQRFHAFFTEEYIPGARETLGARHFPDGEAYYAWRARDFTTTELTPEEIHEIGLDEVARIREEMLEIIDELEFDGDFDDFLHYLRTDEKFYYEDPDDLLQHYKAESKRIDGLLPPFFKTMPRMPYGVRPIPDSIAPDTTTAYYSRPAADGTRAGFYYVNLYRPDTRPKWEIPALSVHEAVPGHHFQIALAQELEGIPNFRRYGGPTAFVEGWALYTEWLAHEMGVYETLYDEFGQLTYEMWRAVRLVVDTGIHTMDWTRDEAIDFFMSNAARAEHDIINEIDRYIAWPGQALAYKIGELRIRELRARAEEALGDDFDIREFHDVVLLNGAIPLDVLEQVVDDWIDEARQ
ncbi:uncharacterized protein (DUF885 family) [Natronospira proteinivora]|uniref:Uncharacterized protein (DUF885 family) n=1 Tax=Natronospira proteinivora TaxID=1807133 RepID=A0ABT1GAW9_9GAMM|nr:DUF885 domain-containing protein [Natronospira proteinivora]MCP1727458.1 uncharacterized protein (DUF885 family) [Natronospira proteinivora]